MTQYGNINVPSFERREIIQLAGAAMLAGASAVGGTYALARGDRIHNTLLTDQEERRAAPIEANSNSIREGQSMRMEILGNRTARPR